MARRTLGRSYTGATKEPAPQYDPKLSEFGNAAAWANGAVKKLFKLMEHYGIDQDDEGRWFSLCLALASDYVPGFKPAQPKALQGRRSTKLPDDVILAVTLREAELQGKSVKNAARLLATRHKRFKGKNPENLY